MRSSQRILAVLALPLLVLLSTCSLIDEEIAACSQYCHALEDCGMLPSFLGVAGDRSSREDCVARCAVTTGAREQVELCMQESEALETELDADVSSWCSLGTCDRLAECLATQLDPAVIGSGTIDTLMCRTPNPVARVPLDGVFESEQCVDACSRDPTYCTCDQSFLTEADIVDICGEWDVRVSTEATGGLELTQLPVVHVDVGRISLELHNLSSNVVVAEGLCEDVLTHVHEAREVRVGLYRTQVVFDDEGSNCFAIPGEEYLVTAGSVTTGVWLLPDSLNDVVVVECEVGLDACRDGIDNDRDGLSDCNDWHCEPYCEVCDDGIDNDADEAIDCLDTDCMSDPNCHTGSDGGSESGESTQDGESTQGESTDSTDSTDSTGSTGGVGQTDSTDSTT